MLLFGLIIGNEGTVGNDCIPYILLLAILGNGNIDALILFCDIDKAGIDNNGFIAILFNGGIGFGTEFIHNGFICSGNAGNAGNPLLLH